MHFTYEAPTEAFDLQQGDLLKRTPELSDVIAKYHPYYSDQERYSHFLVLSQSCDLVRRDGKACSCSYISFAAVRPLEIVLAREVTEFQQNAVLKRANAVSDKNKGRIENFLFTVLNNNSKEYFYLHEEPSVGLYSSCAVLRLSIALKAAEHYETCRKARIITLTDEFRAKLGWLIGNLYARVGTADWPPDAAKAEVKRAIEENLIWLPEEKIKATKIEPAELDTLESKEVIDRVLSIETVKRKEQIVVSVIEELLSGGFIAAEDAEKIKKRLRNAPTFSALSK